jgi:hypothetical protein
MSRPGQSAAFTWSFDPNSAQGIDSVTLSLTLDDESAAALTLLTTVNGNALPNRSISAGTPLDVVVDSATMQQGAVGGEVAVVEFRLVDASGKPVETRLAITNYSATGR